MSTDTYALWMAEDIQTPEHGYPLCQPYRTVELDLSIGSKTSKDTNCDYYVEGLIETPLRHNYSCYTLDTLKKCPVCI